MFGAWGAFRDGGALLRHRRAHRRAGAEGWRPFASVGHWPARGGGGQLHFRLSREKRPGSAVLLRIDERSFQLVGGGRDAWAPDARADAEIVAAMRTGLEMRVETRRPTAGRCATSMGCAAPRPRWTPPPSPARRRPASNVGLSALHGAAHDSARCPFPDTSIRFPCRARAAAGETRAST